MIPAVSAPRRDGRSSFAKLHRYLTVERGPGTKEPLSRGPVILSENLLSLETAAAEMRVAANQNPRVSQPLMHFQLAWKPGELPSEGEWQASAKRAIEALGFGEHQYVIAAHADKEHFHVHVMLNRIHPETAKAHNPRLSLLTLHRVARELEHEYGWAETPGLYRWENAQNEAVRNTKQELHVIREHAETVRGITHAVAAKQDHFRDEPSLKVFASKQPAETLRKILAADANWQQVHLALARHGLILHKAEKGGYTVGVENSEVRVKASDVFRFAFSGKEARMRTETQLGAYQPAKFGKAFDPPVIDYSQVHTPEQQSARARFQVELYKKYAAAARDRKGPPRSINDRPKPFPMRIMGEGARVNQIFAQTFTTGSPERRPGVRLVVRPGNFPGSQVAQAEHKPLPVPRSPEERRQQWEQREAEAGRQRRKQRVEERARERQELKQEFQAAKIESKAALHWHTESARARRGQLLADLKDDRLKIRQIDLDWSIRKACLSARTMDYVQAKLRLNYEIARERSELPRTTFQQWVEERAEAGDKRAVAQMRGWRYQDSRNLQRIDRGTGQAAGELRPEAAAGPDKHTAVDWQEMANERLRQMKEQPGFRDAVNDLRWKADSKTGNIAYSLRGKAALVDQGHTIVVLAPDRNPTRVALQMAVHKYGSLIDAHGTEEWKRELIRAAVQDNVRLVFTDPELQQRLVLARQIAASRQQPQQTRGMER